MENQNRKGNLMATDGCGTGTRQNRASESFKGALVEF